MSGVYLDYNASALVRPEVLAVMAEALADNGNPSAVHAAGRRARARVETARAKVAELVGADPTAVVFTSGGTEANAQALQSAIAAGCERLIVSATEHPCVAEAAANAGVAVEILPVDDVTVDYYSATQGSWGLQVGAQQYAHIILFMTPEALANFRSSPGWTAGADMQYATPDGGQNAGVDTTTTSAPVVAYVFGQAGFIIGATLSGTKYTRIIP